MTDENNKKVFKELCNSINLDSDVENQAWKQYLDTKQNYKLDGEQKDWMCCSIFTTCNQTKLTTVAAGQCIYGNCVSLAKLILICNMDIYTFFEKMHTWSEVATVSPTITKKVENIQRRFTVTEVIYKKLGEIFCKLFVCPPIDESKVGIKSSKKSKPLPCTAQKLFEMCWCLFIVVKGDNPEESLDLVNSINLLLSCLDLIYKNVLYDNRKDLLNPEFPGYPKDLQTEGFNWDEFESFCIIDKLCNEKDEETIEVMRIRNYKFNPVIKRLFERRTLSGQEINFLKLFSVDNFESNFKKINELYQEYILSCGEFDERIFLNHFKKGSKFYGKEEDEFGPMASVKRENYRLLVPETPLSGQKFLGTHPDSKLTPLTAAEENVRKLRSLMTSSRDPQPSLAKLLQSSGPEGIILDLRRRLDSMLEVFCKEYISYGLERFKLAEALYYHFLESLIKEEMQKNIPFHLFIKDENFNKSLIVLSLEIVQFAFTRQKDFPRILEVFNLDPFHFYKLIELIVKNNLSLLTRDIIKHLQSIEEQCLDSLAWRKDSELWRKIEEYGGPLPNNQNVDIHSTNNGNFLMTPTPDQNGQSGNRASRSLKLFFRKFYSLAHLRIKHLCMNLNMCDEELMRKFWTIFENAIIEQTDLMKDRHLDQIWMCCIYVLCKIRPNELKHTFADIMRCYRLQPQAGSHIYRSVFIEYVEKNAEHQKEQQTTQEEPNDPKDLRGNGNVYGSESRGDIIHFYNKIFVKKMQNFAIRFSSNVTHQNNLLLSPLPTEQSQNRSPIKISQYHGVYVVPYSKQDVAPTGRSFTYNIGRSPSKELQIINSLIHQSPKIKRLNIDAKEITERRPAKIPKFQQMISDRQKFNDN